jgi:beta-lactamase regulating signal transducer with metallopeptidase domain
MNLTGLDVLTPALHALVHATWQAGVLAVIVFAVTHCAGARLRANWRFALWLVVFARLAILWVPSAPWSLYSFLPKVDQPGDVKNLPAADQDRNLRKLARQGGRAGGVDAAADVSPPFNEHDTAAVDEVANNDHDLKNEHPARMTGVGLWHIATLIWLTGALALVIRMIWLHVRLARWRAAWPSLADPALGALLEQCRGEARVRPTIVLQLAPGDIGPAACGVLSPVIVLPQRLIASLGRDELRLVLLHELIHVRRHDALVDLAAWGIACVHWFNPAAWLALAGLRRERELACDAALLDLLGAGARRDYGSVLLKAVETLQSRTTTAGAVAMFERRFFSDPLERRIQMIANYRPATGAARIIGGMLLIGLTLLGLTDAAAPPASETALVPAADLRNDSEDKAATAREDNESKPDKVLPPIPAEHPAAEKIRALGGWYKLDKERHVIEVSMVYHYDSNGKRSENEQKTDKALAHLPDFPRLKRLLLTETQVSDDGLEFVGRLPELEELFIWDGATITDKGVAHLRKLPKLKFLLLGNSAITDEAVSHLSDVSTLETLLLDTNSLTDKALEYASRLPRLRELEVGNWGPEGRQATITAAGLEHVRKMPALKRLGIPLIPTKVEDLRQLHGLTGLEMLTIEDVLFQGKMNETAIRELQKATPQLKVLADRKMFPALIRIAAGADPKQQEIYRQQGAEGLKVIERFLELMWAKRDAEAAQLGDLGDVDAGSSCRQFRNEPGFVPFHVTMAYADSENVLAITEPPVTCKIYELQDGERRETGRQTRYVIMKATRTRGTWRVKDADKYFEQPGSKVQSEWFQQFLTEYPGAQELVQPAKP